MKIIASMGIVILLSACSSVKIYDDPWCADAGAFGAECFNTVSKEEFSLNKYEWDRRRLGQICTATLRPGEGYKHIKVALEKLCSDSNFCTPEQKASLARISQSVDEAIGASEGAPTFNGSEPAKSAGTETKTIQELGLQPEK